MATPAPKLPLDFDPTIYPEEEKVGEGSLQRFITELFRGLLERFLGERGRPSFVGADQFVYFQQFDAHRRIAPDVLVLPGVKPGAKIDSWKTWETGVVPSFCLEVPSRNWIKDYVDSVDACGAMGVGELVIFDPEFARHPDERHRFTMYRRAGRRGFVRVEGTNRDRVCSRVLGCWLRAVGDDLESTRLRIATGARGERLFPTAAEAARARAEVERARADVERMRAEAEQARAEVERTRAEAERTRAEAERTRANRERAKRRRAEAALARLEAEIARRGATRKSRSSR